MNVAIEEEIEGTNEVMSKDVTDMSRRIFHNGGMCSQYNRMTVILNISFLYSSTLVSGVGKTHPL